MSTDIQHKAASGIVWTSIQKFTLMGIQFVSGIILARLLSPSDFGCIGMLSIFMVIASSFVDAGFGSALIQKKRPTDADYSTIFFWNLGMASLMYAALFFCAPAISRFYKIPLLCPVLRVQGLVLFINSFRLVQGNQLKKQFKFKKIAIAHLVASVTALSVTIFMAYKGLGVWALVAQNLLTAFIPTAIYWLTSEWRPSFLFSKESFKELFGFGFFMFLTHLLTNVCNNVQGLLIGRIYNSSTMGYYSKAKHTEELASTSVSGVIVQVTYPLYSEFQHDKEKLGSVIRRMTSSIAFISFPIMFMLVLAAKPIFVLLYSDKWLESVYYFQILCAAGLAICLQSVNGQAIAAIGKSRVMFRWTVVKRAVGLLFIVGGLAAFGLNGLLAGMVIQSWFIYAVNAMLVSRYIGLKLWRQILDLSPILGLSAISAVIAYFGVNVLGLGLYADGIVKLLVFALTYYLGSIIFRFNAYQYFKSFLPLFLKKFFKKNK